MSPALKGILGLLVITVASWAVVVVAILGTIWLVRGLQ